MGWPEALKEIASLLKKWGGAIAAYFAGRASKAREQEKDDGKAIRETLDDEREIHRRRHDPDERRRVRERYTRRPPADDTQ